MCRRLSSYAALCALSMLSACEKSATGPVQVTVSIVPSEVEIEVGGQAELQAIVTASGGAADPHPVDWRSSDTNIAQVSATGLVTGIGPGQANISATVSGSTASASVRVVAALPTLASVAPTVVPVGATGATLTVSGTGFFSGSTIRWNGSDRPTRYVSSTELIATLTSADVHDPGAGNVTLANGSSRISAQSARVEVQLPVAARARPISASSGFSCAAGPEAVGYCWGENRFGRLGNGSDTMSASAPAPIAGGHRFRLLALPNATVGATACGVTTDNRALCWGDGRSGGLGDGTLGISTVPRAVAGELELVDLSVGFSHVCGAARDGSAYCWGSGWGDVLGNGASSGVQTTPLRVPTDARFVAIEAGELQTCALTALGEVYCWGVAGLLGNGEAVEPSPTPAVRSPVRVSGSRTFATLSVGGRLSCGLTVVGELFCWGMGGLTAHLVRPSPVRISNLRFRALSVTEDAACAIGPQDSLYCWGVNAAIGVNTFSPTLFAETARAVTVGATHACIVRGNGGVACWGDRGKGQLGDGVSQITYVEGPTEVAGGGSWTTVAAGHGLTCGVGTAPGARCWGFTGGGILGDGPMGGPETCGFGPCATRPSPVVGGEGLTAVTANRHACGLNPAGEALCWGLVLGVERTAPISGSTRFAALSAGLSYTCGLTSEGRALCWGNNESGQLGDGTTTNRTEPAPVSTPVVFKSISAGSRHTCAISVDDELFCWGSDAFGQLAGRGSDLCAPQFFFDPYGCGRTPTLVASGTRFTSVAIGTRHTCAVTTSNRALCWGSNQSGELGVASSDSCTDPYRFASPPVVSCSRTPLIVPGVQEWSAIDAGERHTCGLTVSGDAYCWGVLQGGETPNAPTVSYGRTPVAIPGPRFTALSTGFDQVCGITVSAALYCWGFNLSGQLGLGVATRERNPVSVIGLTL